VSSLIGHWTGRLDGVLFRTENKALVLEIDFDALELVENVGTEDAINLLP